MLPGSISSFQQGPLEWSTEMLEVILIEELFANIKVLSAKGKTRQILKSEAPKKPQTV
jgi:hypothetical protein